MLSVAQQKKLLTCDYRLYALVIAAEFAIERTFTEKALRLGVACGHRTKEEQEAAFASGNSGLHWPNSKHNVNPSDAVDVFPMINGVAVWENDDAWEIVLQFIRDVAKSMRIKIRLGADWKKPDTPHIELM